MDNIIGDNQDDYTPSKFRTIKRTNNKINQIFLEYRSGLKVDE